MAEAIPDEVEVKLEAATPDVLQQIARLRTLGPYRLRARRAELLQTTYYDTADGALVRAAVALRVRRAGRRWEATAKWPGAVRQGVHARPELTVPLPGPPAAPFVLPAGPLRDALHAYVLDRPLVPLLRTDITRRPVDLLPARGTGAPLAEIALDRVALCTTDGTAAAPPYCEVEIEQRAGTREDCIAAARALRRAFALVPSRGTKFARGLAALGAAGAPLRTTVAADDTLLAATHSLIAAQLARLRGAVSGVRRGDPEAIHQMRVAVRRLRTVVRLGRDALPGRGADALRRELRWLGAALGGVRDLDVQLARLDAHAGQLPAVQRRRLTGYRSALRRRRDTARAGLREVIDGARVTRLLLALERAATPGRRMRPAAGDVPVARAGREAVRRAQRRLRKRGRAVGGRFEAEDLHALRIRAKRLRYLVEALAPFTGRAGRRLVAQLTELQDVLGRFNDAIIAAATVREYLESVTAHPAPATRAALHAFADAELRRAGVAQGEFHHAWRRVTGRRAAKRVANVLAALRA